jgi:tetratricopeptide (TPR) repeat protein
MGPHRVKSKTTALFQRFVAPFMNDQAGQRFSPFAEPGAQPDRRAIRLRIIWLMALAIVGAFVGLQIPRELGRWELASAIMARKSGEREAAYEKLNSAIAWFPDNAELLLQRAEWRLADGKREEALADADRMLELSGTSLESLQLHSQFLQNAGEFRRAVDDWKKIDELSQRLGNPNRATALNGLAYAQALAKVDLGAALTHVNEALETAPNESAILDTRGFILHQQGQDENALEDMDRSVKGVDELVAHYAALTKRQSKPATDEESAGFRPKTIMELRPAWTNEQKYASAARAAAVIHYHRSLVLAALDRQEEAEQEHDIAKKLAGREPDETLF